MSWLERKNIRPGLVMVYADSAYASQCGRYFRRQGWEVHLAPTWAEGRRLTQLHAPRVVLLEMAVSDAGHWSFEEKLCGDPQLVLLADENSLVHWDLPENAVVLSRSQGIGGLAEAVLGRGLAHAV